jgi:hypothetical protein
MERPDPSVGGVKASVVLEEMADGNTPRKHFSRKIAQAEGDAMCFDWTSWGRVGPFRNERRDVQAAVRSW